MTYIPANPSLGTSAFYIDPYEDQINFGYAVSRKGEIPVTKINYTNAEQACKKASKRLCKPLEFYSACVGPNNRLFSFQDTSSNIEKICDVPSTTDTKVSSRTEPSATGSHPGCKTEGLEVYDMIGGVSEWVDNSTPVPGSSATQQQLAFGTSFYDDPTVLPALTSYCDSYILQPGTSTPISADTQEASVGFRCCADQNVSDPFAPTFPYVGQ